MFTSTNPVCLHLPPASSSLNWTRLDLNQQMYLIVCHRNVSVNRLLLLLLLFDAEEGKSRSSSCWRAVLTQWIIKWLFLYFLWIHMLLWSNNLLLFTFCSNYCVLYHKGVNYSVSIETKAASNLTLITPLMTDLQFISDCVKLYICFHL